MMVYIDLIKRICNASVAQFYIDYFSK